MNRPQEREEKKLHEVSDAFVVARGELYRKQLEAAREIRTTTADTGAKVKVLLK